MHEYELTILGETVTVESDKDLCKSQIRNLAIEKLNSEGEVTIETTRTFKVSARFSGCTYYVAGLYPTDAVGNLETFLGRLKTDAMEDVPHGTAAWDVLVDMNTTGEVIDEAPDMNPEIDINGERTEHY